MKLTKISPADDGKHKYIASFCECKGTSKCDGAKKVKFGAKGYKDYIQYSKESHEVADKHREAYIARHSKEDWTKPDTAGTLSRFILWEKRTLKEAIKAFLRRFKC